MKSLIKLFGIIALVAIFGFSMASCDNDSPGDNGGAGGGGGGGGGNGDDPTELRLSGVAVTFTKTPVATNFGRIWGLSSGKQPMGTYITGTPSVQLTGTTPGSTLSIVMDAPKASELITISDELPGATVSPSDAKGFIIYDFETADGSHYLTMDGPGAGSICTIFIFVDKDVTINGTGTDPYSYFGLNATFENVSLSRGWNFVVLNYSTNTFQSASQTQPEGVTWRVDGGG
ncbi:MAG: hypothetical protein FWD87_06745 [Spirochaetaceae bacterium]|nr:hypothetical protein [Spirochaetaceae bacterium]